MRRVLLCAALALSCAAVPDARPKPADRKFNSTAIDALIAAFQPRFIDPDLGQIFANALPNTLDTTVVTASANDTFIVTGDITAMWLRDSTNQVLPYMAFASQDAALRDMLHGVVLRQCRSVLIDTYANAFNFDANGAGHQDDQRTPKMTPAVFEGEERAGRSACAARSRAQPAKHLTHLPRTPPLSRPQRQI